MIRHDTERLTIKGGELPPPLTSRIWELTRTVVWAVLGFHGDRRDDIALRWVVTVFGLYLLGHLLWAAFKAYH